MRKRSGLGQQIVYRGGFPMANPRVSLPHRRDDSLAQTTGIVREGLSNSVTRAGFAAEMSGTARSLQRDMLPRLQNGGGGVDDDEGLNAAAVQLTEEMVDRFRKSIWPPPSIPAFGSWPNVNDVLERARDIVSAGGEHSMMSSSAGMLGRMTDLGSTTASFGQASSPTKPPRSSSVLSSSKARVKGSSTPKLPPPGRPSAAGAVQRRAMSTEPQLTTEMKRAPRAESSAR